MKKQLKTFAQLAPAYLAERSVTTHYAGNVRRTAARAGGISVELLNQFLAKRAAAWSAMRAGLL